MKREFLSSEDEARPLDFTLLPACAVNYGGQIGNDDES